MTGVGPYYDFGWPSGDAFSGVEEPDPARVGTPAAPAHRSPSPQLTKSSACAERLWRAHTAIVSQQMCQLVRCGNSSRGKCDLLRAPLRIEFLRYHRPQLQVVSETAVVGRLDRSRVSLRQRSGLGEDRWALKHR